MFFFIISKVLFILLQNPTKVCIKLQENWRQSQTCWFSGAILCTIHQYHKVLVKTLGFSFLCVKKCLMFTGKKQFRLSISEAKCFCLEPHGCHYRIKSWLFHLSKNFSVILAGEGCLLRRNLDSFGRLPASRSVLSVKREFRRSGVSDFTLHNIDINIESNNFFVFFWLNNTSSKELVSVNALESILQKRNAF